MRAMMRFAFGDDCLRNTHDGDKFTAPTSFHTAAVARPPCLARIGGPPSFADASARAGVTPEPSALRRRDGMAPMRIASEMFTQANFVAFRLRFFRHGFLQGRAA